MNPYDLAEPDICILNCEYCFAAFDFGCNCFKYSSMPKMTVWPDRFQHVFTLFYPYPAFHFFLNHYISLPKIKKTFQWTHEFSSWRLINMYELAAVCHFKLNLNHKWLFAHGLICPHVMHSDQRVAHHIKTWPITRE